MKEKDVLKNIADEVDIIISQHAIYINRLEKALKKNEEIETKTCHECNLGKLWDNDIVPNKKYLNNETSALVEETEDIHCKFHDIAKNIVSTSDIKEKEKYLNELKKLSSDLFRNLLKLKHKYDNVKHRDV